MLVLYECISNAIHVEPMKSQSCPAMSPCSPDPTRSETTAPKTRKNEASTALQQFETSVDDNYQLAPTSLYRCNEPFEQTSLPVCAAPTRTFRSTYGTNSYHGVSDQRRTPLAPLGTRVLVHERSFARGTCAPQQSTFGTSAPPPNITVATASESTRP
jgi:hypothetical protein